MGWWVYLKQNNQSVSVKSFCFGSNVCADENLNPINTAEAEMSLTYNYSKYYYQYLDSENGLRALNGKRAGDWIEKLKHAIEILGTQGSDDYWESTPGNAGFALSILLEWAGQYPDAIFEIH